MSIGGRASRNVDYFAFLAERSRDACRCAVPGGFYYVLEQSNISGRFLRRDVGIAGDGFGL